MHTSGGSSDGSSNSVPATSVVVSTMFPAPSFDLAQPPHLLLWAFWKWTRSWNIYSCQFLWLSLGISLLCFSSEKKLKTSDLEKAHRKKCANLVHIFCHFGERTWASAGSGVRGVLEPILTPWGTCIWCSDGWMCFPWAGLWLTVNLHYKELLLLLLFTWDAVSFSSLPSPHKELFSSDEPKISLMNSPIFNWMFLLNFCTSRFCWILLFFFLKRFFIMEIFWTSAGAERCEGAHGGASAVSVRRLFIPCPVDAWGTGAPSRGRKVPRGHSSGCCHCRDSGGRGVGDYGRLKCQHAHACGSF